MIEEVRDLVCRIMRYSCWGRVAHIIVSYIAEIKNRSGLLVVCVSFYFIFIYFILFFQCGLVYNMLMLVNYITSCMAQLVSFL